MEISLVTFCHATRVGTRRWLGFHWEVFIIKSFVDMCLLCGLNRVLVIILLVSDCCFIDDACRILIFSSSNSANIQLKNNHPTTCRPNCLSILLFHCCINLGVSLVPVPPLKILWFGSVVGEPNCDSVIQLVNSWVWAEKHESQP
jgi:hypothetical protein